MRRHPAAWMLALLLPTTAAAQAPPAEHVETLVKALGSGDPAERDRATRGLLAAGEPAKARLEALVDDPDAEVASRARFILDYLPWEARCPGISTQVQDLPLRLRDPEAGVRLALIEELLSLQRGGVADILAGLLDDPDPKVRQRAVTGLGELGDRRVVERLRKIVRGEAEGDRQSAMVLLGRIGDPAAIPDLVKNLAHDDTYIRRYAVDALIDLDRPEVPNAVRPLLDTNRPLEIRGSAALVLAHYGDAAAAPILAGYARHWDADARRRTGVAIGLLGDPALLPVLREMAKDHDSGPRFAAVASMGALRGGGAAADLIPFLLDTAWEIRDAAMRGLARCDRETFGRAAAAALKGGESTAQRARVLEALAELPARASLPAVLEALRDPDRGVRAAAARAAGASGDPSAAAALMPVAAERDPVAAGPALDALGLLKAADAEPELRRRLADSETPVRAAAARALGRLGRTADAAPLRKLLQDDKAEALGALRERTAGPDLLELLGDRDPAVQQAAAGAVATLADPALAEGLEKRAASREPWARTWALRALGRAGRKESLAVLQQAARDPSPAIRRAAAESLGALRLPDGLPLLRQLSDDAAEEVSLAAMHARVLSGDRSAAESLPGWVMHLKPEIRAQAIAVVRELKDRDALRALVEALADEREVTFIPEAGAKPREAAVSDLALEALEAVTGEGIPARTKAAKMARWRGKKL